MKKAEDQDKNPTPQQRAAAEQLVLDRTITLTDRGRFVVDQVVDYYRGQIRATGVWTSTGTFDDVWFHRSTIAEISERY